MRLRIVIPAIAAAASLTLTGCGATETLTDNDDCGDVRKVERQIEALERKMANDPDSAYDPDKGYVDPETLDDMSREFERDMNRLGDLTVEYIDLTAAKPECVE